MIIITVKLTYDLSSFHGLQVYHTPYDSLISSKYVLRTSQTNTPASNNCHLVTNNVVHLQMYRNSPGFVHSN